MTLKVATITNSPLLMNKRVLIYPVNRTDVWWRYVGQNLGWGESVVVSDVRGKGDICVNSVSPAVIQTPILDQLNEEQIKMMLSKIPLGRTGKPDEVAALVHFLASRECSFTTGQCYDISGGRATY